MKGSSPEFPYTAHNFHVQGISYSVLKDPRSVEVQEKILQQRIDDAREDQAAGRNLDADDSSADAADNTVQDIRGIDLGAGGCEDGTKSDGGRHKERISEIYDRKHKICPVCPQCPVFKML